MELLDLSSADQKRLPAAWKSLESGRDMTAFQSWEWAETVRSHVHQERLARAGASFRCLVVTEGSEPILLAPLRIQRVTWSPGLRRGIYFLGHTTSSDYLDFVYRDFRPEALELMLAHVRDHYHMKSCVFDRMLADAPSALYLAGRSGSRVSHHDAVGVEIPDTRTQYERLLTKRFRQNVRTAINRATKDGIELDIAFDASLTENDIDVVRRMYLAREQARQTQTTLSRTQRSARSAVLWGKRDSGGQLLQFPNGWNVTVRNSHAELIAIAAGLRDRRSNRPTVRVNLVAYDERFSRYSPGILGLHAFIIDAIDDCDGPRFLDLTRGEERYKFDLGGRRHPYVSVSVPLAKDR